jgi:hypothetical protein
MSALIPRPPVGYCVFHLADLGDPFIVPWPPTYSQPTSPREGPHVVRVYATGSAAEANVTIMAFYPRIIYGRNYRTPRTDGICRDIHGLIVGELRCIATNIVGPGRPPLPLTSDLETFFLQECLVG